MKSGGIQKFGNLKTLRMYECSPYDDYLSDSRSRNRKAL